MNITKVTITRQENSRILAYADIVIGDDFVVKGFKVINGKNGLFVSSPNRKAQDGEYHDIAHAITSEAYQQIQSAVLEKYEYTPELEQVQERPILDVPEDTLPF